MKRKHLPMILTFGVLAVVLLCIIGAKVFSLDQYSSDKKEIKKLSEEWIDTYYSVDEDDLKFYDTMVAGFTIDDEMESYKKYMESYNEYTKGFKDVAYADLFQSLEANRLFTLRLYPMKKLNSCGEIKNLELDSVELFFDKMYDKEFEKWYDAEQAKCNFEFTYILRSLDDGTEKIIPVQGSLTFTKFNDQWKLLYTNPQNINLPRL